MTVADSVTILPATAPVGVARDPARMVPAADNRTLEVTKGDRPAQA